MNCWSLITPETTNMPFYPHFPLVWYGTKTKHVIENNVLGDNSLGDTSSLVR